MPRFDPTPWNLGLPVCAIATACGPVLPLEPMGPTSLGETDPEPFTTSDDGASSDAAGCVPPCPPNYDCNAGTCVPSYGCEFGCCYEDQCCYEDGYGCEVCYDLTACASGSFCEYQSCVPIAVPPDCEAPLTIVEMLGPTPGEVGGVFSLAFVETDGNPGRELVIGDDNGAVLVGDGGATVSLLPVPADALVEDITSADFDLDGREDIALSATPPGDVPRLVLLRNAGGGAFTAFQPSTSAAFDIVAGDMNGDGLPEIVGALEMNLAYRILGALRNEGGLEFEPTLLSIDAQPLDIDIGDIDADGLADVVAVDNTRQQLWYGTETLDNAADLALVDAPFVVAQVVLADFDGNGRDDLVRLANIGGWTLVDGWASMADGLYEVPEWGASGEGMPNTARAGDLDGDGHADLVHVSGPVLHVRFGAVASDMFGCAAAVELPLTPYLIAVGDFTADGLDDVAVSNNSMVYVYTVSAAAAPP